MSTLLQDFPTIKQGSDFVSNLSLTSTTVSTGDVTFLCQIRRYSGGPVLADVQTSWNGTNLFLFIPHDVTSKLPATGNLGSPTSTPWVYDIIAIFTDQSRLCLSEGKVYVDPTVTTQ
jgi:hypothetical protein